MIELLLSIVACSLLVIAFKVFEKFRIQSFPAIVINYGMAGLLGILMVNDSATIPDRMNEQWVMNAIILGLVFVLNFYVMSICTIKMGASVTSVASKMSLVITVLFGIIYFDETAGITKIAGIIIAIISVFLIIQLDTSSVNKKYIFLPIILFIGGGYIDISLNFNRQVHLQPGELGLFAAVTFTAAFACGLLPLFIQLIRRKIRLGWKELSGGVILGGINWYSIYFLLEGLNNSGMESSTAYTMVNIGILLLVVVCGVLIFREKLNRTQWIGIIMAFAAIALISLT